MFVSKLVRVAAAVVMLVAMTVANSSQASGPGYGYSPAGYGYTVARPTYSYSTVLRPVVKYVTKYDHCGRPYQVKVVTYERVRIPCH